MTGEPHLGPSFLGLYGRDEKLMSGKTVRVDEAFITQSMMEPSLEVVEGYADIMPTYQGRLHGAESAAIVEYIKSLSTPNLRRNPSEGAEYEPDRLQ